MGSREELQQVLETALGSRNVYYNPPATLTMKYDAIRYSLSEIRPRYANDAKYLKMKSYDGIIISRDPDPEVIDKILDLPFTSFAKPYVADNLHHYPFTIYY